MTRITENHRLAHRAVLAVCAVLSQAGALAETIKNDYGEDLLVQTHLEDLADNFHILIQAKGTKLKPRKNGNYSLSLELDHIRRWVSHMQPVLVCVFDEQSGNIFAFYPRSLFSLWDLNRTDRKSMSVSFNSEDIFDASTARKFIWECRVEYFSRSLAWYENSYRYLDQYGRLSKHKKAIISDGNMVVWTFLHSLGFFTENDKINTDFINSVKNASTNFAKRNIEDPNDPLSLRAVFMLSLLGLIDSVAGVAIPGNLMEHGTDMAGSFFKAFHPEEWAMASQRVNDPVWLSKTNKPRKRGARLTLP